jgi:hypothetical protein
VRALEYTIASPTIAGLLDHLTTEVVERKVAIEALCCVQEHDGGLCRLVTAQDAETRAAVDGAGYTVSTVREVLVTSYPNRPRMFQEISSRAAKAGISVDSAYLATNGRVVIGCDDVAALTKLGLEDSDHGCI